MSRKLGWIVSLIFISLMIWLAFSYGYYKSFVNMKNHNASLLIDMKKINTYRIELLNTGNTDQVIQDMIDHTSLIDTMIESNNEIYRDLWYFDFVFSVDYLLYDFVENYQETKGVTH